MDKISSFFACVANSKVHVAQSIVPVKHSVSKFEWCTCMSQWTKTEGAFVHVSSGSHLSGQP